jgi:hypothetical protein
MAQYEEEKEKPKEQWETKLKLFKGGGTQTWMMGDGFFMISTTCLYVFGFDIIGYFGECVFNGIERCEKVCIVVRL